jgi:hypothetical protein
MSDLRMLLSKTATSELKKQLREAGVRGYSKMKKEELVNLLHTSLSHRPRAKEEEIPAHLGGDESSAKLEKVKGDKPKVKKPKAEKKVEAETENEPKIKKPKAEVKKPKAEVNKVKAELI